MVFRVFSGYIFPWFLFFRPVLFDQCSNSSTTEKEEIKPKHTEKKEEKPRNTGNTRNKKIRPVILMDFLLDLSGPPCLPAVFFAFKSLTQRTQREDTKNTKVLVQ